MSEIRIIKKYPNRRLYDTEVSAYITLERIRELVQSGVDFQVIEKKSGDDITRNILLQIISEQEDKGEPVFGADMLKLIIRLYGDSMQGVLGDYMLKSLELFLNQRSQWQEQVGLNQMGFPNPLQQMTEMAQKNLDYWTSWQKDLFSNTPKPGSSGDGD